MTLQTDTVVPRSFHIPRVTQRQTQLCSLEGQEPLQPRYVRLSLSLMHNTVTMPSVPCIIHPVRRPPQRAPPRWPDLHHQQGESRPPY